LAYQFADEPDMLPLPLRLSEFHSGMTAEDFIVQGWAGSPDTDHWGAPELASNLEGYLEARKLFFMFDALNEMPREGYQERVMDLRRFIDRWSPKGHRFLVTCRVLDYGEELSGLQRVEIQPLAKGQIRAFLRNELPAGWRALWKTLAESGDEQRRLLEMARNPYLLTMMIDVFAEDGQLGRNRAELMSRFTQILMSWARTKCPPDEWLDADVQREALLVLAFETQDRAGFGAMVNTELVKAVMPRQVQPDPNWPSVPSPPDQVLTLAASANIIEMPVDRSSVRFYHQLLQEYFAAGHMLKQDLTSLTDYWRWDWLEEEMDWKRPAGNLDPLPPPPPTGWEETTILAAGLAAENDDQLVRTLIRVNPVLAGRCLHEGRAKVDQAIRQAVIDALLATISNSEVALRVRIAAGDVLGYLGDPRLGELVTVPAGKFLMGDDEGFAPEKPQHKLYLLEYQIGKYPVTNVGYGRFIEAGGYHDKRWWTETGWAWKEQEKWTNPRGWNDSRFNKPNHPVIGVSWYECVAYCRWLSAENGHPYRLPTEAEWEKAARGTDGRLYPWGNDFEVSRLNANVGTQVVWATTPVGIYPDGVSPFGAFDCVGNMREWCTTRGAFYPYDVMRAEWAVDYLGGADLRVFRGGSWGDDQRVARCAYRDWLDPHLRDLHLGCRVVVGVVSPVVSGS
ncbi:MAG: formylglycine-generating enzyme family protein, partial [Anaerolineae bacterium]